MRELVQRGVSVLPLLLRHLDDARPTKILVGGRSFAQKSFESEYEFRDGHRNYAPFEADHPFEGQYTVKVGDVCEVLIGQIVNRDLLVVRYQPTAILIVNSPIATPKLAEWMRQDWGGLTSQEHEASLLSDLRRANRETEVDAALVRLRFYYSNTYSGLAGADRGKRDVFEARERQLGGR